MRDLQTPQKERQPPNRRSKFVSEQTKRPPKVQSEPSISKKCLDSVFASTSEEDISISLESPKDSIDFSPISEVSDDNWISDTAESFTVPSNRVLSPSSETVTMPDLALVLPITADKDEEGNRSVNLCRSPESKSVKNNNNKSTVEAELVANHLRQARIRVLNSDADPKAKRLLDMLVKAVIEEFYSLPEERDCSAEMVSTKIRNVFVSLSLWMLAVLVVFVFSSGGQSSFNELAPT